MLETFALALALLSFTISLLVWKQEREIDRELQEQTERIRLLTDKLEGRHQD